MHTLATVSKSATVLGFFMAISHTVLMSLASSRKALMISILDIRDGVPSVAETFYVVTEALIMLLLYGLQCLGSRWMLIHALKVLDKHGT
jgi:hypothetical protein